MNGIFDRTNIEDRARVSEKFEWKALKKYVENILCEDQEL